MQIGRNDKIALIGGAIAALLFVTLQFAILPVWDSLQENRENLPVEEKKLEKYREVARTVGLRTQEVTTLEAKLRETEGGLLASNTATLASGEMQGLAKELAAAQGIDLRSNDFPPPKLLGGDYTEVPVGLQFQCRVDQLVSLLKEIAANPKYLTVDKLAIQTNGNKDKSFSVSLQIAGIMRAEPVKKEGSK